MPAKSEKQRKLFGIALSIKRGETPASYSPEASSIAESLSEKKIRKYAKKQGASGAIVPEFACNLTEKDIENLQGYELLKKIGAI